MHSPVSAGCAAQPPARGWVAGRRCGAAPAGPPGTKMCSPVPLPLPTISSGIKTLPPLGLRMLKGIWKWLV